MTNNKGTLNVRWQNRVLPGLVTALVLGVFLFGCSNNRVKEEFTVEFKEFGDRVIYSQIVLKGEKAEKPEDPNRGEADFLNWVDASTGEEFDFDTVIERDYVLTAQFTGRSLPPAKDGHHWVIFHFNDGNKTPWLATEVKQGEQVPQPVNPTYDGFTFVAWYEDDDTFLKMYNFSTPIEAQLELYANWDGQLFTISFDSNGGSPVSSQMREWGQYATRPAIPTRGSDLFTGWTVGGTSFDFEGTPIYRSYTLLAGWTQPNPGGGNGSGGSGSGSGSGGSGSGSGGSGSGATTYYTVIFNLNGGTSTTPGIQTVASGEKVTPPANPTRENNTFNGWWTTAATGGRQWNFSNDGVTANETLYARWNPQMYTVTFNGNGGSAPHAIPRQVAHGAAVSEPDGFPERTGYTFVHWSIDQNSAAWLGNSVAFNFSTPITGNTTLYAKYVAIATGIKIPDDGYTQRLMPGTRYRFRSVASPTQAMQTNHVWRALNENNPQLSPHAYFEGNQIVIRSNAPIGTRIRVEVSVQSGTYILRHDRIITVWNGKN